MIYNVTMIHPNANADFTTTVRAPNSDAAANIAREQTAKKFGTGHWFMVGEVSVA